MKKLEYQSLINKAISQLNKARRGYKLETKDVDNLAIVKSQAMIMLDGRVIFKHSIECKPGEKSLEELSSVCMEGLFFDLLAAGISRNIV